MIEEDHIYAKRRNFEVNIETNKTICIAFLLKFIKQILFLFMHNLDILTNFQQKEFSKNISFIQVLHLWSEGQASLTPEFLMSKVLLWQRSGYVSKDVWNEMHKIVGSELLPSQQEINETSYLVSDFEKETKEHYVTDERDKLSGSNVISIIDDLFYRITESVYPSKRKHFALLALGLEESEYDQIITETKGAKKRNAEVVFENDLYF